MKITYTKIIEYENFLNTDERYVENVYTKIRKSRYDDDEEEEDDYCEDCRKSVIYCEKCCDRDDIYRDDNDGDWFFDLINDKICNKSDIKEFSKKQYAKILNIERILPSCFMAEIEVNLMD